MRRASTHLEPAVGTVGAVLLLALLVATVHVPHLVAVHAGEHSGEQAHTLQSTAAPDTESDDIQHPADVMNCHYLDILTPQTLQDAGVMVHSSWHACPVSDLAVDDPSSPILVDLPRPRGPSRQALLQRFIL